MFSHTHTQNNYNYVTVCMLMTYCGGHFVIHTSSNRYVVHLKYIVIVIIYQLKIYSTDNKLRNVK